MLLNIQKESEEVYHTRQDVISLSEKEIDFLISIAKKTTRKRVRLCCHLSVNDAVHEMVIVHPRKAYVRPHRHLNKAESFLVLKGEVDYVTFKEKGEIDTILSMGDSHSNKSFYQSIRSEIFHTLVIQSEWLVFLEVTQGPFKKEDTEFADWSPVNPSKKEIGEFIESIYKEKKS